MSAPQLTAIQRDRTPARKFPAMGPRARPTLRGAHRDRQASEQSYRDLISTINGIIWEADNQKDALTYVSDSAERILGYTPTEWLSDQLFWEKHLHPDDARQATAQYRQSAEVGHSYEATYRMIAKDGAVVWIHEVVSTIAKNGKVAFMRGVMVDITSLKTAEQSAVAMAARLAESEKHLSTILDTAAIGIVTVDDELRITSFNLEAERIFGREAGLTRGRPIDLLMPAPFTEVYGDSMTELPGGGVQCRSMGEWCSMDGLAADGRIIPLATILSKMTVAGKTSITVIMRDMTALQKTEKELQRQLINREVAVVRVAAENSVKSTFLAIMSHELRTPLNAIIGFSELMNRETMGPIGNEAYRGYVADIHQSGELLLSIVNSILDLSCIESGKREINIETLSLEEVWYPIARTLALDAKEKGVDLSVRQPVPGRKFSADRGAIAQIVRNLVSNAIKFTPVGGAIEIGQEHDSASGELALCVTDNGRGIPKDRLSDVLKPFTQVSDSHVRDTGGVGLGLAICNSLAVAMSGRIAIQSRLGKGTTVRVFLPSAGMPAARCSA